MNKCFSFLKGMYEEYDLTGAALTLYAPIALLFILFHLSQFFPAICLCLLGAGALSVVTIVCTMLGDVIEFSDISNNIKSIWKEA